MLVNFYSQLYDEQEFLIGKYLDSIQLAEFVMEFYGEMIISRKVSNELEVCIILDSKEQQSKLCYELIQL